MTAERDIFYHPESSGFELNAEFSVSSEFTSLRPVSETDMHVLYKGLRHGRIWILKGLQPFYKESDECRQMLVKEFDIMMSLQHRNIVAVHSIESVGHLGMCIVMEYVNGMTLNEWLRERHPLRHRLQVAFELCDAFAFINKCGIVHRDIKPENIMISRIGGGVKIIDFGHADTDNHSLFKYPAGTENFISPEQMTSIDPDVRNDIYSFGKVLDFLLPEKRFNKIRGRCVAHIEGRFSGFEEIKMKLFYANRKLPVLLVLSGIIVCMGVISVYVFTGDDERKISQTNSLVSENFETEASADSTGSLPKFQSANDIESETGKVQLTDEVNEGRIAEKYFAGEHDRMKELPDIQNVLASINEVWEKTANTYLDTIGNVEDMYPDWSTHQMELIRDKFLDSLPRSLALKVRTEIKNQIDAQIDYNYRKWHKRRMEMMRRVQYAH